MRIFGMERNKYFKYFNILLEIFGKACYKYFKYEMSVGNILTFYLKYLERSVTNISNIWKGVKPWQTQDCLA